MKLWQILFWVFTISLVFVNPLISFGLIVLYYLPGMIRSLCAPYSEKSEYKETIEYTKYDNTPIHTMKDYSDDILEEMK